MATLSQTSFEQHFISTKSGITVGIHRVFLSGDASDTFQVPELVNSTSGDAVKQLNLNGQSDLTVTNTTAVSAVDGAGSVQTVTVAGGSANEEAIIVTLHSQPSINRSNFIREDTTAPA